MKERRMTRGVTTADISGLYIRMVEPWCLVSPWYMLGDHGPYSVVIFR